MGKNLFENIFEAIEEARILECAMEHYSNEHVVYTAQRLSGAPASFVEDVFKKYFSGNPQVIDL